MTSTPRYAIEDLATGEDGTSTANEAHRILEAFTGYIVVEDEQTAPPGSPNEGDIYIVLATGTGDWAGQDGDVAVYVNGAWLFFTPFEGLLVYLKDVNNLEIYTTTSFRAQLHTGLATS